MIALHSTATNPDRFVSAVLSDPYFPGLRHLEDLSRWGHWRAFQAEAHDAGVSLSAEHWYDIGRFFDQVGHLDGEALLKFRHAVGLPALNRLLRLGKTTCGDDAKLEAGLTSELIEGVSIPVLALYGDASPFLATAQYLVDHLADCRQAIVPNAKHRAGGESKDVRSNRAQLPHPNGSNANRNRNRRRDRGVSIMNIEASPLILLTGAAGGIGRAAAKALAARGYRLACLDRAETALGETVADLEKSGAVVFGSVGDVRDRDAVKHAVAESEARLGPIDVLLAAAGVGGLSTATDLDTPKLGEMLEVNVLGVAHAIEAVLPGMIARGHGHIVGISSVAGFRGMPWMPGYSASKAALTTYLEGLRPSLKRRGVRVTTVFPGFVRTALTEGTPFRRPVKMLEPEQAALWIVKAIEKRPRDCVFPFSARRHGNLARLAELLVRSRHGSSRAKGAHHGVLKHDDANE